MQAGLYFLLFIGITGFIQWLNKKELSLFFWGFAVYGLYWLIDAYYQPGLVTLFIALVVVFFLSLLFTLIDEYMRPVNDLFIFIKEFDLVISNAVIYVIKKLALFARLYIASDYDIKPAMGIALYEQIAESIRNYDWCDVEKLYLQGRAEEKSLVLESISENFQPKEISPWVDKDELNPVALLFYGKTMAVFAWESRKNTSADMIRKHEFETFFKRLYIARQIYLKVIDIAPDCAEAYAGLLSVMMGLQEESKESWIYFVQLIKLQPEHFWGHMSMLTLLCEKWCGSHEAMFNFARHTTSNLEKGSALHAISAMAHIEKWLYHSICDEEDEYRAYFNSQEVTEEINTAFLLFMENPRRNYSLSDYAAMNIFAFCFYQMKQINECTSLLRLIDDKAVIYPWYYCDSGILGHTDTSYIYSRVLKEMGLCSS